MVIRFNRGMVVLWIMVLFTVLPLTYLFLSKASSHFKTTVTGVKNSAIEVSMEVLFQNIAGFAKDVDSDGYYELPKETVTFEVPALVSGGTQDINGNTIKYYTWDLGDQNTLMVKFSDYQASAPPHPEQIGRLISPGPDKVIETTRDNAVAVGDDIVMDIYQSDITLAQGLLNGWVDVGDYVRLIDPDNRVGVGTETPSTDLEVDGSLRLGEASSSEQGTIYFDSVDKRFKIYDAEGQKLADEVPDPPEVDFLNPIIVTSDYTLSSSDLGRRVICAEGSGGEYTLTLPAGAAPGVFYIDVKATTHFVNIAATTGLIDGQATRKMWEGESATLASVGNSNWAKVGGISRPITFSAVYDKIEGRIVCPPNNAFGTLPADYPVPFDRYSGNVLFEPYVDLVSSSIYVPRSGIYNYFAAESSSIMMISPVVHKNGSYLRSKNSNHNSYVYGAIHLRAGVDYLQLRVWPRRDNPAAGPTIGASIYLQEDPSW